MFPFYEHFRIAGMEDLATKEAELATKTALDEESVPV